MISGRLARTMSICKERYYRTGGGLKRGGRRRWVRNGDLLERQKNGVSTVNPPGDFSQHVGYPKRGRQHVTASVS